MKKITVLTGMLLLLNLSACKKNIEPKTTIEKEPKKEATDVKTYAEISIKEGGHWEGRKYLEGTFKNVDSVKVPAEHTDHSWYIRYEGPGWESNKIGYRLYLDWRNAIDIFGINRCIFATNFPVDRKYSNYDKVLDSYTEITKDFSDDEKNKIFHGNAIKYYRL